MKTHNRMVWLLLAGVTWAGPVLADSKADKPDAGKADAVKPDPITPQASDKGKESAPPPVLALAPADALFIVYLEKPADVLQHSLLGALDLPREMTDILASAADAFTGPTMLAFCGSPIDPFSIRLELATQPATDTTAFFSVVKDKLLAKIKGPNATASIEPVGNLSLVRIPGPVPLAMYFGTRDGIAYGSGHVTSVESWLKGEPLSDRFVSTEDFPRLLGDAEFAKPKAATDGRSAMVYVNARALMPAAEAEFDRSTMPGLFATLGLDRLESAALALDWSTARPSARVVIGLADGEGGIPELLAPRNSEAQIAGLVPQDYTGFVRGSLNNATDLVETILAALRNVDPAIVQEYQDECREFKREFGFDPHAEFLANLADEWLFSYRLSSDGPPSVVVAFGLADPNLFETQFATLTRGFGLEYEQSVYRDAVVRVTPPTASSRFALATVDRYLVFARDAANIHEFVDAWADERAVPAAQSFGSLMRQLPAETAQLMFLNLAQLCRVGADEVRRSGDEPVAFADALDKVAASDAAIGLTIASRPNALDIQLACNESVDHEVGSLLVKSIAMSIERSRVQSRRMVSMSNIRGIITSCMIYANDHKGVWPDAMSELVRDGSCLVGQFVSPLEGDAPVGLTVDNLDRESHYLYRPGTGLAPTEVVVCERSLRDGGANFGFADGHVEWINGPRAEELLAMMQRHAVNGTRGVASR